MFEWLSATEPLRDSLLQHAAAQTTALLVLLGAVGLVFRKAYRFLKMAERFAEVVLGSDDKPSLVARLDRIDKELHPNHGTSMRDELRGVSRQIGQVQETAAQATTAAGLAVGEAKVAAAVALETAEERRGDVQRIYTAMMNMREEIATDAAQRQADAYELLADNGGPDLRAHLPIVPPHKHELPKRTDPTLTGGPVDPEE